MPLSTTIPNGVVVVPCSLNPRTWNRSQAERGEPFALAGGGSTQPSMAPQAGFMSTAAFPLAAACDGRLMIMRVNVLSLGAFQKEAP